MFRYGQLALITGPLAAADCIAVNLIRFDVTKLSRGGHDLGKNDDSLRSNLHGEVSLHCGRGELARCNSIPITLVVGAVVWTKLKAIVACNEKGRIQLACLPFYPESCK